MKLFSLMLFSISLLLISCDDCFNVDCQENQVWLRYQDKQGNELLGLNSSTPDVKFVLGKDTFPPSKAARVSGNTLFFEQTFSPGIAIVDFLGKKDTIELIKPIFNQKTDCCKLPFSDSIIVNKKIRLSAQGDIIITQI